MRIKSPLKLPVLARLFLTRCQVQVDQASQFNAALTVGSVDTSVEVTATAPLLQSDRADVAETFTSKADLAVADVSVAICNRLNC